MPRIQLLVPSSNILVSRRPRLLVERHRWWTHLLWAQVLQGPWVKPSRGRQTDGYSERPSHFMISSASYIVSLGTAMKLIAISEEAVYPVDALHLRSMR